MAPLRPRCTPPLRHRAPPNVAMAAAMLTAEGRGAQGDGGVRVGARAKRPRGFLRTTTAPRHRCALRPSPATAPPSRSLSTCAANRSGGARCRSRRRCSTTGGAPPFVPSSSPIVSNGAADRPPPCAVHVLHGIAAPLARRRAAPPRAAELSSAAGCRQPTAQRGRLRRCSASPDTRREPGWSAPSRRGTLGTRSRRSTCVSISQPRPCPHRCSRGFAVANPPAVSAARWSWKFGETPFAGTSRGCAVASDGCSLPRLAPPTDRAALAPARK